MVELKTRENDASVAALLAGLGKHKTSVSCLYINKLDDIDLAVLEQLVAKAFDRMKEIYGVA